MSKRQILSYLLGFILGAMLLPFTVEAAVTSVTITVDATHPSYIRHVIIDRDDATPVTCNVHISDKDIGPPYDYVVNVPGQLVFPYQVGNIGLYVECDGVLANQDLMDWTVNGWTIYFEYAADATNSGEDELTVPARNYGPGFMCDLGTAVVYWTTDGGISVYRADSPNSAALTVNLQELPNLTTAPTHGNLFIEDTADDGLYIVAYWLTSFELQVQVGPDPRDGKSQKCIWNPWVPGSAYMRDV